MATRNFSMFLSTLVLAASFAGSSPSIAQSNECAGTPPDAVMVAPSPLGKWAQIACTPFGEALGGRDGWIWASLKDAGKVVILAGAPPRAADDSGDPSYFTGINVSELSQDERALALASFHTGMEFKDTGSKAYRVEITAASGSIASLLFFDFGTFAGGMWCPKDACNLDSRFLIMKQESKDQFTASLQHVGPAGARLG